MLPWCGTGVRNTIYYRHWTADAPRGQVLLLHGFGEHTDHYHRLAGQLTAAGFEVYGPDHVGHGHTGGPAGMFSCVDELAANAGILLDLMTAAHPDLPTVVVGHSLGAVAAALLALRAPDARRGLVMTGAPLWGLPPAVEGRDDLVMSNDGAYLDALANDPLGFDTGPAEANLWRALTVAGCKVRTGLPALMTPVLLVNGEHDVFAPPAAAAQFATELQNGRAVVIPGGYHDIPNDVTHREVAALIVEAAAAWCAVPAALSAGRR